MYKYGMFLNLDCVILPGDILSNPTNKTPPTVQRTVSAEDPAKLRKGQPGSIGEMVSRWPQRLPLQDRGSPEGQPSSIGEMVVRSAQRCAAGVPYTQGMQVSDNDRRQEPAKVGQPGECSGPAPHPTEPMSPGMERYLTTSLFLDPSAAPAQILS